MMKTIAHGLFLVILYCQPILSQDDCGFMIRRPPDFPDIMSSFMQTFNFDPDLLSLKESLVDDNNHPDFCNCTAALVEDWVDYNSQCEAIQPECPVRTTTTEEPTTTTTEEPTTTTQTPSTTPTTRTTKETTITTVTTPETKSTPMGVTTPNVSSSTTRTTVGTTSSAQSPTNRVSTTVSTTSTELSTEESTTLGIPPAPVVDRGGISNTVRNIIIACVCGLVLALVVVITTLCVVRKQSSGDSAHLRAEKLARQRSDCQPLPDNTFDSVPTTPSTRDRDSLNGYTNNGFQWPLSDDSKVLNLDAPEEEFHYNTLKALEHPHALMTGFGETSTETLPKKSKKRSTKKKKTDANHNSKGSSVGKNSVGKQSADSLVDKGSAKSSVKSKASVRSKDSGLGTKRNSGLPPAPVMLSNDLMKFSTDADDLVDGKNAHFFAYNNGLSEIQASNTSLTPSLVLPPPPEFQDIKPRDSPFNSNDRRTETPPTAVVRPSVKEHVDRQESHSSSGSGGSSDKKPQKTEQVNISMEDMSTPPPEPIFIMDSNHTPEKPQQNGNASSADRGNSFLWSSPNKQSPNALYKRPENMQKTVL